MKIHNIHLIGTSHIARQSLEDVERTINKVIPKIVAVELDKGRAIALMKGEKSKLRVSDIKRIGVKGFLFAWFGAWAERKLGDLVGMKPGDEMLHAIRLAKVHKARVALIDQEISITLRRFSNTLTWKEKARIAADIFKSAILRRPGIAFDLRTVPDKKMIKKLTDEVKVRYPNIYKVLIDERNIVMAHRLVALSRSHPEEEIVAVMGAGHVDEVAKMIKKALKSAEPQK